MEKDILTKVIEVEKEIQDTLDGEKRRSEEWVEKVRMEIEEEVIKEDEDLKKSFKETEGIAIAEIKNKSSEILEGATRQAEGLSKISDEDLNEIIKRHIMRILPGR